MYPHAFFSSFEYCLYMASPSQRRYSTSARFQLVHTPTFTPYRVLSHHRGTPYYLHKYLERHLRLAGATEELV